MAEDGGKLVTEETRRALTDLTNLPRKRGISSILGDFLQKSEGECGKRISDEGSRVEFSKRLCVVVDDLVKENAVEPSDTIQRSPSDAKNSCGESSGDDKTFKEIYFEPCDRDGVKELNANQTNAELSVLSSQSQNLRSFELSRCSNVNKDEHVNVNQNMGDDNLLKSCSCSFCLKAAYIWSDLHYQDIKGRLSALKKSQKEASNLINRNGKETPTDFHSSVSSAAKLESDLTGQWRSLFLSMGDILAHESNHLQNSFMKMKELREDCKIDLERATKTPHHNNNT